MCGKWAKGKERPPLGSTSPFAFSTPPPALVVQSAAPPMRGEGEEAPSLTALSIDLDVLLASSRPPKIQRSVFGKTPSTVDEYSAPFNVRVAVIFVMVSSSRRRKTQSLLRSSEVRQKDLRKSHSYLKSERARLSRPK